MHAGMVIPTNYEEHNQTADEYRYPNGNPDIAPEALAAKAALSVKDCQVETHVKSPPEVVFSGNIDLFRYFVNSALAFCRFNKFSKERMWSVWPRLKLRMELRGNEKWMVSEFDDFYQILFRIDTSNN